MPKVRICRIMLREINLLVLDEPTNHLDVDAKDALKQAIKDYKGTCYSRKPRARSFTWTLPIRFGTSRNGSTKVI